jgi:hypothetical protein
MEKLKEIDEFMRYFPKINIEEDEDDREENKPSNKRGNKNNKIKNAHKNVHKNGMKNKNLANPTKLTTTNNIAMTLNEINQKVQEKMIHMKRTHKQKKPRPPRRGKVNPKAKNNPK